MARIVDAQKIDVLREIVLEDYNAQLDFKMSPDGSGSININITDPRTREREEIRTWVSKSMEEDMFLPETLLSMLDERDKKSQKTWGAEQGQPLPYSVTIRFDDKIASVLQNFFSSEELRASVRETIRSSFKSETDTKGF